MKFSKKIFRISIILIIVFSAIFIAMRTFFTSKPIVYPTALVKRVNLEDVVLASGVLKPVKQVKIGAQVTGQLQSLKVRLGQKVKKGDLLAEIDPVQQEKVLRKAQLYIDTAQALLESKEVNLRSNTLAFERQKIMLSNGATSQADFDEAKSRMELSQIDVRIQKTQISQANIDLEREKTNLDYTKITAPIDGEVIEISAEQGQTLISSQSAPTILILANIDRMLVQTQISEADVTRVSPGNPVYFTTLGVSDKVFFSKLQSIEPATGHEKSSGAVYYNGLFEIANPEHGLKPSMNVQVSIVLNHAKQALAIPVTALGKKISSRSYEVKVLDQKNQIQSRLIKVGINDHIYIQVLQGLAEGEKVIIDQVEKQAINT